MPGCGSVAPAREMSRTGRAGHETPPRIARGGGPTREKSSEPKEGLGLMRREWVPTPSVLAIEATGSGSLRLSAHDSTNLRAAASPVPGLAGMGQRWTSRWPGQAGHGGSTLGVVLRVAQGRWGGLGHMANRRDLKGAGSLDDVGDGVGGVAFSTLNLGDRGTGGPGDGNATSATGEHAAITQNRPRRAWRRGRFCVRANVGRRSVGGGATSWPQLRQVHDRDKSRACLASRAATARAADRWCALSQRHAGQRSGFPEPNWGRHFFATVQARVDPSGGAVPRRRDAPQTEPLAPVAEPRVLEPMTGRTVGRCTGRF